MIIKKRASIDMITIITSDANLWIGHYLFNSLSLCWCQSRSSLYAEYASCLGPPKHQGPLALKDDFILVSFLHLANGYENMNDNLL